MKLLLDHIKLKIVELGGNLVHYSLIMKVVARVLLPDSWLIPLVETGVFFSSKLPTCPGRAAYNSLGS
jgi:hypothetical protein